MSELPALPAPMGQLPAVVHPELPAVAANPERLIDAWLEGRCERTRIAYANDLEHFARWLLSQSPWRTSCSAQDAARALVSSGPGPANGTVLAFRAHMLAAGLSTATVARRIAALRSVVAFARLVGLIEWSLSVQGPPVEARRDVRGPDKPDRRKLWSHLAEDTTPKGRRDYAMASLMFGLGLRRAEVLALDVVDVDLPDSTVAVLGKGRREKIRLTIPGPVRAALAAWVKARVQAPGPLFVRLDPAAPGLLSRLSGDGLARIVAKWGRRAKLRRVLRPHGLRHAAATQALDSGMDVRKVRQFTRHKRLDTVLRYDDARHDYQGQVADVVAKEQKGR